MQDNRTIVALDAMGGDNAPGEIVAGALDAVAVNEELKVMLVGDPERINQALAGHSYDPERISIVPASEVIETGEPPVNAIRRKKDSSIVVGLKQVRDGEAHAFVSAGSTGAVLVGGQLIVGRIRGIDRTPIGVIIPTTKGIALLIDSGANVDVRPHHLVQFAQMGTIYMRDVIGVPNPRVGLINIGVEEDKGNALVKETYPLLKETEGINFIGNIEAREIPHGGADILLCDAFVGNVILKLYEGTADALISLVKKGFMSTLRSKIGALLVKPALKQSLKGMSASEYGGAPMLGLKGLVIKTHGSAKAREVTTTLLQCITFRDQKIVEQIRSALGTKAAEPEDSNNSKEAENV